MAAPNSSAGWLERLFKLSDNKTTFRTEVLAGVTTFFNNVLHHHCQSTHFI